MEIKTEEIIAIGDNSNDKKMIQEADLGIAMKNSSQDVIQVANYVTEDNNNEGVAKALEKFIF